MRITLLVGSLACLAPFFSVASEISTSKPSSIFAPSAAEIRSFPFISPGEISVSKSEGGALICRPQAKTCSVVGIAPEITISSSYLAGPFVSPWLPSWIAYDSKKAYLCAAVESQKFANCLKLGNIELKDIALHVEQRGAIPYLTLTSSKLSSESLQNYAEGMKAVLQTASSILAQRSTLSSKSTTIDDVQNVEDIEVVEVPGTPPYPPDPGNGGIGTIPLPDIPGGPVPTPPTTGGGGDTGTCTGGRGVGIDSDESQSGGQCMTPEELLQRCLDSQETLYHEVWIPACQRVWPLGSPDRAVCYGIAMDRKVEGQTQCRDTYRQMTGGRYSLKVFNR